MKGAHTFEVTNHNERTGVQGETFETRDPHAAYSHAYKGPSTVIVKIDGHDSIVDDIHFSPTHPLWSREKFLKWAMSRGHRATAHVRRKNK